jgi:hypothetical protein
MDSAKRASRTEAKDLVVKTGADVTGGNSALKKRVTHYDAVTRDGVVTSGELTTLHSTR